MKTLSVFTLKISCVACDIVGVWNKMLATEPLKASDEAARRSRMERKTLYPVPL